MENFGVAHVLIEWPLILGHRGAVKPRYEFWEFAFIPHAVPLFAAYAGRSCYSGKPAIVIAEIADVARANLFLIANALDCACLFLSPR